MVAPDCDYMSIRPLTNSSHFRSTLFTGNIFVFILMCKRQDNIKDDITFNQGLSNRLFGRFNIDFYTIFLSVTAIFLLINICW